MPNYSRAKIAGFWRAADAATATAAKGKALEDLTCYLFEKVPGVRIARRNVKNAFETEEIDVAIWNEQHPRGLINFNAIILIECKNWSKAVESSEVSWFLTKLENRGLDFGVLIAANGITGDAAGLKEAHSLIALALAKKIRMVVITRAEIDTLGSGEDLVEMIRTKVCDLIVTGTVVPLQGSRQGVSFPRA